MEYRYIMYDPVRGSISRLNGNDFDTILFNETILNVVQKKLNNYVDVLIYEMLSYNISNDTTSIFYLIAKRNRKD